GRAERGIFRRTGARSVRAGDMHRLSEITTPRRGPSCMAALTFRSPLSKEVVMVRASNKVRRSGCALCVLACAGVASGQVGDGELTINLVPVATGLVSPVKMVHAGDGSGRLFIVEQDGLIKIMQDGKVPPT